MDVALIHIRFHRHLHGPKTPDGYNNGVEKKCSYGI